MTVQLTGVDASYHMNQEEKTRIWRGKTYEAIAREIFDEYGFKPVVADPPGSGEAPAQVAQRATDHRFLRGLARRRGYEFYVLGGNAYFRPPDLGGQPQKLIAVNFGEQTNCHHLQFEADGTAPTAAQVSYFDAMEGRAATERADDSGLPALGARPLSALRGAVAGGAAGNALSRNSRAGVEVTVQLEQSGRTIAVTQDGNPNDFRIGDRVQVSSDGVTTRISR